MIDNPIIFYIASFILALFTMTALFARNIISSLLASIMVFFSTGLFFYVLGSEYNAIIQAAIYGFAVPIIIALAIMFSQEDCKNKKNSILSLILLISAVIFTLFFTDIVILSLKKLPQTFNVVHFVGSNSYDVISAFAKGIFINYVWAFELISLLLTIIVAGFTLFKKGRSKI